jgi:hypothetical protein
MLILLVYMNCTKALYHGVSHMHMLYADQINLSILFPILPSPSIFLKENWGI